MTTAGIPFDAVDFYAELALNNNREWWAANAELVHRSGDWSVYQVPT